MITPRKFPYKGTMITLAEAVTLSGLTRNTIQWRMYKLGMSLEEAISWGTEKPTKRRRKKAEYQVPTQVHCRIVVTHIGSSVYAHMCPAFGAVYDALKTVSLTSKTFYIIDLNRGSGAYKPLIVYEDECVEMDG